MKSSSRVKNKFPCAFKCGNTLSRRQRFGSSGTAGSEYCWKCRKNIERLKVEIKRAGQAKRVLQKGKQNSHQGNTYMPDIHRLTPRRRQRTIQ